MPEIYSEGFWITLAGLIIGFLGLTIRACLKSKCDEVACCGCRIHRAVEVEERIEENNTQLNIRPSPSDNNI
jgi:NAD(P)H-hydrate repair Nnr-like enzyme with NAD(P)H-hydrate dehydratase domain